MYKLLLLAVIFSFSLLQGINQYPLDTAYHSWDNLDDEMLELHSRDLSNSKLEIIGYSTNNKLPIYAMHIHSFADTSNLPFEKRKIAEDIKKVLIIGQHHGEEPVGVEIAIKFIEDLTSSSEYKELKEKYYFVIVPTVNPEAFQIVNNGVYPLKRKNNTDSNENGLFELEYDGVDLNKNYPSNWEIADLNDPDNPYYKGSGAASEDETQSVISLCNRITFDYAFSYHTSYNGAYNELVFIPYNWVEEKSKDWDKIVSLAKDLVNNLPGLYSMEKYEVYTGYTSQYGYLRDWLYREHGTFVFTLEVGPITPDGSPLYFPDNNLLIQLIKNNTSAVYKFLYQQ